MADGRGKGAVLLRATLTGGSGTLNGGLPRPLLDLVTLKGVAALGGIGGSFPPEVLRLPPLPPQACLREEEEVVGRGRGGMATPMGVGGSEME